MKKIDEIREKIESGICDMIPALNLCDALEYVSEALVMVEGPTVGEILAKIDTILEKGKG